MDIVLPDPNTAPLQVEKTLRGWDISMLGLMAGKERTLTQLRELVESVDTKLRFEDCYRPAGSALSLLMSGKW